MKRTIEKILHLTLIQTHLRLLDTKLFHNLPPSRERNDQKESTVAARCLIIRDIAHEKLPGQMDLTSNDN